MSQTGLAAAHALLPVLSWPAALGLLHPGQVQGVELSSAPPAVTCCSVGWGASPQVLPAVGALAGVPSDPGRGRCLQMGLVGGRMKAQEVGFISGLVVRALGP